MTRALIGKIALPLSALLATTACQAAPRTFSPEEKGSPLRLERKIPLADVAGRIDHLAIDLPHHRLFVAEIANGTVNAVDLKSSSVAGRIAGLQQP